MGFTGGVKGVRVSVCRVEVPGWAGRRVVGVVRLVVGFTADKGAQVKAFGWVEG